MAGFTEQIETYPQLFMAYIFFFLNGTINSTIGFHRNVLSALLHVPVVLKRATFVSNPAYEIYFQNEKHILNTKSHYHRALVYIWRT